ncbi:hypothetical protein ScPMuIL_003546 [Solemya velum]
MEITKDISNAMRYAIPTKVGRTSSDPIVVSSHSASPDLHSNDCEGIRRRRFKNYYIGGIGLSSTVIHLFCLDGMGRSSTICYLCGQRWTFSRLCLCVFSLTLVFNEWLVYLVQSWRWSELPRDLVHDRAEELVVLLVSDPQIPGMEDELPFPIGSISRWDADRFVKQGFERAYDYCDPDVVIFLGDLMDEGSKATEKDYAVYIERFHRIFYRARKKKKIYIPGDNDIGGEGRDRRNLNKIDRFENHFESLIGITRHAFVDFIKMDLRTYEGLSLPKKKNADSLSKESESLVKVLINHESVIPKQKIHIYPLLKDIRPQLIISGHWHKSIIFECKDCMDDPHDQWQFTYQKLMDLSGYMTLDLSSKSSLTEIMVPTCSYRMGVENMGYGVLILNSNAEFQHGSDSLEDDLCPEWPVMAVIPEMIQRIHDMVMTYEPIIEQHVSSTVDIFQEKGRYHRSGIKVTSPQGFQNL